MTELPARRMALPALTALALAAICVVFIFVMAAWLQDVGRMLGASGESVAMALANGVDRQVHQLDHSLTQVAERLATADGSLQGGQALLEDAVRGPGFYMAFVVDQSGAVVAKAPDIGRLELEYTEREPHEVQRARRDVGLYVSKPFRSAPNDTWVIALSRRIEDSNGKFLGSVIGLLTLDHLRKLYDTLSLDEGSAVTLLRADDGTIVTRTPPLQGYVRSWAGGGEFLDRVRVGRGGAFEGPSPIDGRRRTISYRRIEGFPLIQVVESDGAATYAIWWHRASIIAALLFVLCAVVFFLALRLNLELARRRDAESALSRLASTDALTNIGNRRGFDAAFGDAWRSAFVEETWLSLLIVDVDLFKSYNDLFGHPAGDAVLKAIALRLEEGAQGSGGTACRLGGEEFVVLLPRCESERAIFVAEDLRALVEGLAIAHPGSVDGVVTVSVGIATTCPSSPASENGLLAEADAALYLAKAGGRNRCRSSIDAARHSKG